MRRHLVLSGILLAATTANCTQLKNVATKVATCMATTPIDNDVRAVLSDERADSMLDDMAARKGVDVVVCAVQAVLNSLTAAVQNDGYSATTVSKSDDTKARNLDAQPLVDRGNAWLRKVKTLK